jgi:hypothetical protein
LEQRHHPHRAVWRGDEERERRQLDRGLDPHRQQLVGGEIPGQGIEQERAVGEPGDPQARAVGEVSPGQGEVYGLVTL